LTTTSEFKSSDQDNRQYIVSKEGNKFNEAELALTPTYISTSGYAPFSPYSDRGTLFFSGRYGAGINECAADSS